MSNDEGTVVESDTLSKGKKRIHVNFFPSPGWKTVIEARKALWSKATSSLRDDRKSNSCGCIESTSTFLIARMENNNRGAQDIVVESDSLTKPYLESTHFHVGHSMRICRCPLRRRSLKVTVMLLPLLGLTWVLGFLAVDENTIFFHYLFAIVNSLQVGRAPQPIGDTAEIRI